MLSDEKYFNYINYSGSFRDFVKRTENSRIASVIKICRFVNETPFSFK